jgi:hypothetical protein
MLVGGKLGGALRIVGVVVFWGLGEISIDLSDIDAVTLAGAAFLPEGPQCTPSPLPSVYWGKP